jgi:hypothetical protein
MTEQLLKELIAIIIGVALIVFSKRFTRNSMKSQAKAFGFTYSQKEVKSGVAFTIFVGTIIIVAALVSMLKITSFQL